MPQTSNPILDDLARLMTDAVGMAQGMRREAETLAKTQIERLLSTMDVVTREEFDVQSTVLARTREKLVALEARLAELEKSGKSS